MEKRQSHNVNISKSRPGGNAGKSFSFMKIEILYMNLILLYFNLQVFIQLFVYYYIKIESEIS